MVLDDPDQGKMASVTVPPGNAKIGWLRQRLWPVSFLLAVPVLLASFSRHWWLADICANLRVQWMMAMAVFSVISFGCGRWRLGLLWVSVFAIQIGWFFRPGFAAVQTSPTGHSEDIVITTANVYTGNRRYDDIQQQFLDRQADIIVVVELSSKLAEFLDGDFADVYPHSVVHPQDRGNFGIGVYSKHPIADAQVVVFALPSVPSILFLTSVNGRHVRVLATHTLPPMGATNFRHRNRHLDAAAKLVGKLKAVHPEVPVVVAGDLNLTPWSPIYHDFCNNAGLVPAVGHVWKPTWYRYPAFPFGLVLDHVLFTPKLTCVAKTVGPDAGSDHRFLTARLRFVGD